MCGNRCVMVAMAGRHSDGGDHTQPLYLTLPLDLYSMWYQAIKQPCCVCGEACNK